MGTFFHDGIEYVLPGILKAYPKDWAEQFLSRGVMYFTSSEVFQDFEDPQRGDPMEGTAVTIRQGARCQGNYVNPIFVWCATMETDTGVILGTWRDRDTVIQVTDPLGFLKRVREAAMAEKSTIGPILVGPVTYDKDEGSHRQYHWSEGIFQKNLRFNGQRNSVWPLSANARSSSSHRRRSFCRSATAKTSLGLQRRRPIRRSPRSRRRTRASDVYRYPQAAIPD